MVSNVTKFVRPVGITTGLGVEQTWCWIFKKNEVRKKKLTDAQITKFMFDEFPTKDSMVFYRVAHIRGKYNRGWFTKKDGELCPPKIQSKRHHHKRDRGRELC